MSKSVSASFCKGKGSIAHNNREFFTSNIDQERTSNNIVYKQEPLKEAYQKCFGEAIDEYNAKQKRADRKIDGIDGYMNKIKNSGNGEKLFYETVVQVGTMYDCNTKTADGEKAQQILDEYMQSFQARNPHLYVFNAVLHLDEETPHLHIDYIPVAEGYKQGMNVRNSLDKALKQQGIDGKNNKFENSTIAWEKQERKELAACIERAGWEYKEVQGIERGNLTINQYRAMTEELNKAVEAIEIDVAARENRFNKDEVILKKDDYEFLLERSKLSVVHEETTQHLQEVAASKIENINNYTDQQMIIIAQLREEAEADAIAAKQKMQQARELYSQQKDLTSNYNVLVGKYNALLGENRNLKAENANLQGKVKEAVEAAVKPLKEKIEQFEKTMNNMSIAQSSLLKTMRYVRDYFAGTLSSAFLNAALKKGNEWLKEDGFEELSQNRDIYVPKSIRAELELDLTFKKGDEGKGLYKADVLVYQADSLSEARELFPNCNIKNELEKGIAR